LLICLIRTFNFVLSTDLDQRDYTGISTLLAFNPGVSERAMNVAILEDEVVEEDEEFFVVLSVIGGVRGVEVREGENRTNVTITDNDGGCT